MPNRPKSKGDVMKILVLTGSHRKNGNSCALAASFVEGAKEAGHDVTVFDCAHHKIGGCMGCNYCMSHDGACVQKDDFTLVKDDIVAADVIVLASPVYYFGITAQIKAVIDRFYAINNKLMNAPKRAALLLAMGDTDPETASACVLNFKLMCGYLGWENMGHVVAGGTYGPGDIKDDILLEAKNLGKNL